jgi:hypothetical protein
VVQDSFHSQDVDICAYIVKNTEHVYCNGFIVPFNIVTVLTFPFFAIID